MNVHLFSAAFFSQTVDFKTHRKGLLTDNEGVKIGIKGGTVAVIQGDDIPGCRIPGLLYIGNKTLFSFFIG